MMKKMAILHSRVKSGTGYYIKSRSRMSQRLLPKSAKYSAPDIRTTPEYPERPPRRAKSTDSQQKIVELIKSEDLLCPDIFNFTRTEAPNITSRSGVRSSHGW